MGLIDCDILDTSYELLVKGYVSMQSIKNIFWNSDRRRLRAVWRLVVNVFWNSDQRRLRAVWRLVVQVILLLVAVVPLQLVLSIAGIAFLALYGGISPDQLGSSGPGSFSPQTLQAFFLGSPVLMSLSTLGLFLAMLLSIWLAGRFLDRRRFMDFGFHFNKNWWADFGFGLFLGAFLMLIIFAVELAAGWVTVTGTFATRNPDMSFLAGIVPAVIIFLAVGIYEELFSRGYQLRNMAEGLNGRLLGPRGAIVVAALLSSAVFGTLHVTNPNASLISTFNIFIAGAVLLSLGLILTGELAIPIGIHITWNFFQGNVFGFPVSGTDSRWATFVAIQQGGPHVWTGGSFGPEAGLIGVTAILLGGLLTILWVRWHYGSIGLHQEIAQAPDQALKQVADQWVEDWKNV
jgi:membrane protease YdiL (CAAX protease family)